MKQKFSRTVIGLALGVGIAILAAAPAPAVDLVAIQSSVTMPDGAAVTMWGFFPDTGQACTDALPWAPGPTLTGADGAPLSITLRNCLTVPVSIVIPGQPAVLNPQRFVDGSGRTRVRAFTSEAAPGGGTATYTWPALKSGTYLYQSGSQPSLQVPMGLYGVLKAGDPLPGAKHEITLLFSEIDRERHDPTPSPAHPLDYMPDDFLINGAPFEAGRAALPAGESGSAVQIRLLNAGLKPHTPAISRGTWKVMAEDGNIYPYPREQQAVLLAPGKTLDVLWTPETAGAYVLYDRALYLTNNGQTGGGMMVRLAVADVPGMPVADAGADQQGLLAGATVTLDGSASTDDTGPLTYRWVLTSIPAGSAAALSDPNVMNPSFVADEEGVYVARLTVNDGTSDSAPDSVTVLINRTPIADAGNDRRVDVGATVVLDGRGSYDPDGSLLTYAWTLSDVPAGSAAVLSDPSAPAPRFRADAAGTYTAQLVVTDPESASSTPAAVTITAAVPVNEPPVATDDFFTVSRNSRGEMLQLLLNDYDPDGEVDPATVRIVTEPTRGGTVAVINGAVIYVPKKNFKGTDVFEYTVMDHSRTPLESNVARVKVNVVASATGTRKRLRLLGIDR